MIILAIDVVQPEVVAMSIAILGKEKTDNVKDTIVKPDTIKLLETIKETSFCLKFYFPLIVIFINFRRF